MSPIFETIMLICFGISWPLNLVKTYKARNVALDKKRAK